MINIFGTGSNLGYGIHSLNMVKAAIDAGEDISIVNISQPQLDPYFESYWKKGSDNLINFNAKNPSLYIFHDNHSYQACGNPLTTFSIFETYKLKQMSINMLNNGPTNIVLTTSEDHKNILINNGITKPIEVLHEGVDDTIYNTIPTSKWIDTGKFTYITVGKKEKRKYTNEIISNFILTMMDKDVALIAHTFNPFVNKFKDNPLVNLMCWTDINPIKYGFEYKGYTGKAHLFTKDKCDIYFTAPNLQINEMPMLYHSANVGIQLSHGEAWNLPLIEQLSCGIPCIASNTLGHREYLKDIPEIQKNLLLDFNEKEIANDGIWFNGDQGEWENIDINELPLMLNNTYNKDIYTNRDESISEYISTNFSWKKAFSDYLNIINKQNK